jgi:hypothetical protein
MKTPPKSTTLSERIYQLTFAAAVTAVIYIYFTH